MIETLIKIQEPDVLTVNKVKKHDFFILKNWSGEAKDRKLYFAFDYPVNEDNNAGRKVVNVTDNIYEDLPINTLVMQPKLIEIIVHLHPK